MGVIPNTAQGGMFKVQKDSNYHGPWAGGKTQNGVTSISHGGYPSWTSFRVSAMK